MTGALQKPNAYLLNNLKSRSYIITVINESYLILSEVILVKIKKSLILDYGIVEHYKNTRAFGTIDDDLRGVFKN